MITIEGNSGNKIEALEADIYLGRCVGLFDLGTETSVYDDGEKVQRKILIQWEVIGETITMNRDGKESEEPRVVARKYTVSTFKNANLAKMLKSWRGKPFTKEEEKSFVISNILNAPCQLQIGVNDNGYNVVDNVMAVGKGVVVAEATLPLMEWNFDDCGGELPTRIQKFHVEAIEKSPEWQALNGESSVSQEDLDRADAAMDAASESDEPVDDEVLPF